VPIFGRWGGSSLATADIPSVSTSGDSVIFATGGQVLPGAENTQDVLGLSDTYKATRGSTGWTASYVSPTETELSDLELGEGTFAGLGAVSPDLRAFAFATIPFSFRASGGSLGVLGVGSLGTTNADPRWITAGGGHVIFDTRECPTSGCAIPLEPDAPAAGLGAIYDRAGGQTRVVSLLPGNLIPTAPAFYEGASADGSAVAFRINGTDDSPGAYGAMYVRLDDATTEPVASENEIRAGQTIDCTGGPTTTTLSYQWLRNGVPIAGAIGPTYTTVSPADDGKVIQCQVFATNSAAGSTQLSSISVGAGATLTGGVVVAPFPATQPPTTQFPFPPSESAAMTVGGGGGQTLTCNSPGWSGSPASITYQWYRNGVALAGATASTYLTTATDVAAAAVFQCAETATNAGGTATAVSKALATSPAPSPAAPVATAETAGLSITFEGLTQDGSQLFYLKGPQPDGSAPAAGNLFDLNTATQTVSQITNSGDATVVNISADGSHVYFTSPSQLDGSAGTAGQPNLYVWDRASNTIHFIAMLGPSDFSISNTTVNGASASLGFWAPVPNSTGLDPSAAAHDASALDTSRSTPDGSVFVFQSTASLTKYDNADHSEIYRYDASDGSLTCISCNPRAAVATSDADLETLSTNSNPTPVESQNLIDNVTSSGQEVLFNTSEALVPSDTNGQEDVYEWEADGAGNCTSDTQDGGCLYLISSGQSPYPSYLYGMTADGSDVMFTTNQALAPQDQNAGGDVMYDARVDGGFPAAPTPADCVEDACQGPLTPPPSAPMVASVAFAGPSDSHSTSPAPAAKVRVLSKTVRGTALSVRVQVPAKGKLTLAGADIHRIQRSIQKAGTYRMTTTVTAKEKRQFKKEKALALKVRVEFAPADGRASAALVHLTVKAPRKPKRSSESGNGGGR